MGLLINERNLSIRISHLKRRFDNEPLSLVNHLLSQLKKESKEYKKSPEANSYKIAELNETIKAYTKYIKTRS